MASSLFLDSSGLFALLSMDDDRHAEAERLMHTAAGAGHLCVTTDYVLDETATLLMARGKRHLATMLFDTVRDSAAISIVPVWPVHFQEAVRLFRRYQDKGFSFTDCTSFAVMRALNIREALSKDRDFEIAQFQALLRR